jgi:hypothetical protein
LQIQTRKRRNGRCKKIEVKINSEKLLYHGAQQEMEEHERNGEAAAGGATKVTVVLLSWRFFCLRS